VGRVLQDDAAAQEPGGRVDDALLVGTAQAQVGEDVVDVAGALDAGQLLADEQPMGGLGDPDVAGAGGQDDDGEVEARDRLDEERAIRGRGLPGLVDDLDDEARSTRRVQAGEEVAGAARRPPGGRAPRPSPRCAPSGPDRPGARTRSAPGGERRGPHRGGGSNGP
jgi:hypothetical protein